MLKLAIVVGMLIDLVLWRGLDQLLGVQRCPLCAGVQTSLP
jgi:hypothetical protein